MTTAIIISLIILVVIECVLGDRVSRLRAETRTLRTRAEWLETDIAVAKRQGRADRAEWRTELDALATLVAKNADRTARLEAEDAPRRPACPATYLAERYPKRADEV